jgi:hypothetical protein
MTGGPCSGGQDLCAASGTASELVILTRIPGLPKFEHHDDRHEPTLFAAARSQMTASSPRGTFSQAELAGGLVTRRIRM